MKKKLLFGASVVITAIAAFAGTCDARNTGYNEIDGNDVYAGEFVNDTGTSYVANDVEVAFLDASGDVVETRRSNPARTPGRRERRRSSRPRPTPTRTTPRRRSRASTKRV